MHINKPKRIPFGPTRDDKKHTYASKEELERILSQKVIIQEKMDGYTTVAKSPYGHVLFLEDLKKIHSTKYRIPGRYAAFDIFKEYFLTHEDLLRILAKARKEGWKWNVIDGKGEKIDSWDIFPVPVLDIVKINKLEDLIKYLGISAYAEEKGEGIVIKPFRYLLPEEQESLKLVRKEFEENIQKHHLRAPFRLNIIDPTLETLLIAPRSKGRLLNRLDFPEKWAYNPIPLVFEEVDVSKYPSELQNLILELGRGFAAWQSVNKIKDIK